MLWTTNMKFSERLSNSRQLLTLRWNRNIPCKGPWNTPKLLIFLDCFYSDLLPENESGLDELPHYVTVWDNVSFHRGPFIRAKNVDGPTLFSFSQSTWGGFFCLEVWTPGSQDQKSLLQVMDDAYEDIADGGWDIRVFFLGLQRKISTSMWMKFSGQTETIRRMKTMATRGRTPTVTR